MQICNINFWLLSDVYFFCMQLERMKNENSLLLQDDHDFDQKFPGLQSEFMKLQKVSCYPHLLV
jgi:hypothetical protein